jgi:vacuolar-type H+-ATPase subunit H
MDAEELIRQATDSVRSALDAAQRRGQEIVAQAETEAERIRAEAEAAAKRIRTDAEDAAGRIRGEAEGQAQRRLEEVRGALDELRGRLSDEGEAPVAPTPDVEPTPAPAEPSPSPKGEASGEGDAAVRLVAMKLALEGTPRDEARTQLAAEFEVADLDGLLDEVYARATG